MHCANQPTDTTGTPTHFDAALRFAIRSQDGRMSVVSGFFIENG
jgi:hypothetical protein